MGRRRYILDIYPRGTVSTTGAPSYTLASSYFRDAPMVGGQIVRAAQCQVESNPWRLTLVDVGSTFTAKIADSSGRLHLLGRLCRVRSSLDSTASYASIGVGRLTDLALDPDIASWALDISDERWVERQTPVFTKANTVAVVPYGQTGTFQGVRGIDVEAPNIKWKCVQKTGNMVCLRYDGALPIPTNPSIAQLIVADLKISALVGNTALTAGNFTTLRWRNTGTSTDYEIGAFGFGSFPLGSMRPSYPVDPLGFWNDPMLGVVDGNGRDLPREKLYVWLVWTASPPTLDANVSGYLYAPTHEPTVDLPQLIGGHSGLHPFTLVRQIYGGTHSATTSLTVRYSTAALDRLEKEPAYGKVWFRIDQPVTMSEFLDERIYGPYQVAPVVDSSGKIAPTRMWLPTSTQLNVAGLATITSTNALAHPTWEHPSGDAVTAVRYTQEIYFNWYRQPLTLLANPVTVGTTRTHDTLTLLGRRQLEFRLGAVAMPTILAGSTVLVNVVFGLPVVDRLALGLFQRFGDGPVYSEVPVTSAIDATTNGAILPGAFIKMRVGTFPNAGTLGRGSTRVMQVLRRDITPLGRNFRLLDAGANLTPLATPTVSLALSTMSSRHAVIGTIASLPVGSRYEAQLAHTSSTGAASPPGSTSGRWFTAAVGTSAGLSFTLGQRPSKTKIYARARASKPLRIGSPWSTANISAVTASIAAPSGLAVSSITAGSAVLKWTAGSSVYGIEVMVDATSTVTLGSSNVISRTPPRTTRFDLIGLNSNDGHKTGVRHFDPWGGRSAQNTATFTTTTAYTAAPALRGLAIVAAKL